MSTGSSLETAVAAAARHYRDLDKCELAKQHTPRLHSGTYQGKSPVDFKGWYTTSVVVARASVGDTYSVSLRQPIYVECKATSDGEIAFRDKGDGIREKQLEAMRDAVKRGIHMILVADFVREKEVYVVDVKHVVEFAAAPWRKSLSFAWCRAYGELAKVSGEDKKRRVWFLDTAPSELQATAYLAIAAERAKHAGERVELFPAEAKFRRRVNAEKMPPPGSDAYRERIMSAANDGLTRAMRGKRGGLAQMVARIIHDGEATTVGDAVSMVTAGAPVDDWGRAYQAVMRLPADDRLRLCRLIEKETTDEATA